MATIKKQSILGTLSAYSGVGIGFVNKLILFPIAFINQEEYWGLIEFFASWAILLGAVTTMGVPMAFQRYLPGAQKKVKQEYTMLGNGVLIISLLVFAVLLLTQNEFIAGKSSAPDLVHQEYLSFVAMAIAMFLWEWGNGLLTANSEAHVGVFWNTIVQRMFVTGILVTKLFTSLTVDDFIHLVALSYIITSGVTLIRGMKSAPQSFRFGRSEHWKDFLQFSGISVLNKSTTMITGQIDVLIGGLLLPMSIIPILGISKFFNTVLLIPGRAVSRGSSSLVSKAWKNKDYGVLTQIYKKTALAGFAIGATAFSAIWIGIDHLVDFREFFAPLPPILWITAIGVLFNLSTGVNGQLINLSDFYKLSLWSNLFVLVIALPLNYYIIKEYGLVGAAAGLTITAILSNTVKGLVIWYKIKCHPFTTSMLYVLFTYGAVIALRELIPHNWTSTAILAAVWMVATWLIWVKWKLLPDVYEIAKKYLPKRLT